jgi:hypothetical protein
MMCQSAFHHCDKLPEINNTKEEGFVLAHGFRVFSSWLFGSAASGHMCGEAEHHGGEPVIEQSASQDREEAVGKRNVLPFELCPQASFIFFFV